jgi:hypothetical protein
MKTNVDEKYKNGFVSEEDIVLMLGAECIISILNAYVIPIDSPVLINGEKHQPKWFADNIINKLKNFSLNNKAENRM